MSCVMDVLWMKKCELVISLLPHVILSSISDKSNSFTTIILPHRIKSYIVWL
jgi:hypothetical protein